MRRSKKPPAPQRFNGKVHRRHRRMLAEVRKRGVVYVRGEMQFKIAEQLHKAGLCTACVSKFNLFDDENPRPFRELAVYASETEALKHYRETLPRN